MDLNRPRRLAGWLGLIAPALLTFLQPLTMSGATLKAGVASADITPPFGKYRVVSSGKIGVSARDTLYAKVLVLEDSQTRIAIVSLDLCYAFPPEMFDPYRQRLKRAAGIDYVVLNASHTHNGPETIPDATMTATDDELRDMPWNAETMEKIYQAVLKAHSSAVPVLIGFGYGESTIGTNRRLVTPQGVKTLGRTSPDKIPVEPSDRRVGVLRLDREDGTPLAVVVHYACHPVTLMTNDATDFSADYVGEMRTDAAARIPGHPEVLFLQGAAGDINLRDKITGSGEQEVKRYGHELANAVVDAAAEIQTRDESGLSYRFEILKFPSRWPPDVLSYEGRRRHGGDVRWFEMAYHPDYSSPVGTLILGKTLALAFLPDEPFIDYQFELDRKSPIANTLLVGYCERGSGYLPTIRAAAEGGYGGNDSETLLSIGAGDIMVLHAVIQLDQQLGLFHELPLDQ